MPQMPERVRQLRKENPEKYREYDRTRYAANPGPKKAAAKRRREQRMATEPEKVRAEKNEGDRRRRQEHPDKYRARTNKYNNARYHRRKEMEPEALRLERYGYRLKARYKVNGRPMTVADYDAFLEKQGGHCALCARTPDQERYGRLSVDHDWETEEVRGLLCASCNTSLGHFGDSEAGVLRLLAYVRGEL